MRARASSLAVLLFVVGACSAPDATDVVGTWDFTLDQAESELVVANFAGLIGATEDPVIVRLGFDGEEVWQGFVFDGELYRLDGAPRETAPPMT